MKQHPWFKDFDWNGLDTKVTVPGFIPDIKKNNWDNNHVNVKGWNDTEEVAESTELLRRASQRVVFETYYFDKSTIAAAPIKNPEAARRASRIQDALISSEE